MSEAQAERAVQAIYEDPGLREELVDEEADILLKWGEDRAVELSERGLEDEPFDRLYDNLRLLIAQINRFIGKREGMPPQTRRDTLIEISKLARLLDYRIGDAEVEAFEARQAALPADEALRDLTAMIKPKPPASGLADALQKGLNSYDTWNERQQPEE